MIIIKLGDEVSGEFDQGKVIAMTKNWCIYQTKSGEELAEEWPSIDLLFEKPSEPQTQLVEKER